VADAKKKPKVYVVTKLYSRGPEAECIGVFRRKRDAIETIESDEEEWDDDLRCVDEDFWGNAECSMQIEEVEIE